MTQDRIQINGVWYVKEDQAQEPIKLDPSEFKGIVVENEDFCFEATTTFKYNGDSYDHIDINFTDKRVKPWKEELWDNNAWMRGVLNNNPESLKALPDIGSDGIRYLQAFLKHLTEKQWL